MTGHLLPDTTLALIRRNFFNLAQVAERQAAGMKRHYEELDRALALAVEQLGRTLEHVEALEEADASDVAYAGLSYVHTRHEWHKKVQAAADDEAAFTAMCEAQTALDDAAAMYSAGFEDAK